MSDQDILIWIKNNLDLIEYEQLIGKILDYKKFNLLNNLFKIPNDIFDIIKQYYL
jgi:hypothetical protein